MKRKNDIPYERQMLQILQNYERLQQEVVRLHSENRRLESDNAAMKTVLSDKTGSWHHVDLLIQQIKHLKDKIADYQSIGIPRGSMLYEKYKALLAHSYKLERSNSRLYGQLQNYREKHKIFELIDSDETLSTSALRNTVKSIL